MCPFSPLWTMNHEALTCSQGDVWGVRAANVPWGNNPATVHVTLSGWSQTQSTLRKKGKSLQETLKPLELSCSQLCALQFPLLKDQVLLQLLSETSSVDCFSLNVPISSWLSPQTPPKSYNLITNPNYTAPPTQLGNCLTSKTTMVPPLNMVNMCCRLHQN